MRCKFPFSIPFFYLKNLRTKLPISFGNKIKAQKMPVTMKSKAIQFLRTFTFFSPTI